MLIIIGLLVYSGVQSQHFPFIRDSIRYNLASLDTVHHRKVYRVKVVGDHKAGMLERKIISMGYLYGMTDSSITLSNMKPHLIDSTTVGTLYLQTVNYRDIHHLLINRDGIGKKTAIVSALVSTMLGVYVYLKSYDDDPERFFAMKRGDKAVLAGLTSWEILMASTYGAFAAPRKQMVKYDRKYFHLTIEYIREMTGYPVR